MKIKYVFFVLALSVLLTGCSKKVNQKKENDFQVHTIGFLIRNTTEPFLNQFADDATAFASEKNIPLQIMDANADEKMQLEQLDILLAQGVRSFLVIAQTTPLTNTIAKKIVEYGGCACFSNVPPTIQALEESNRLYYVSSPEISCGLLQAAVLDSYFKKNPKQITDKTINLLILEGSNNHPAKKYRLIGLNNGLVQAGYTVTYVDSKSADWSAAAAQPIMDRWLAKYRDSFDAVVAQNDDMAIGAISSLLSKNYTDTLAGNQDTDGDGLYVRVPVIGADGTDAAIESMENHLLYGTVLQDCKLQVSTAFEILLACQKNKTAIGYVTSDGIAAEKEVMEEEPMTDKAVIGQCFLVPFKPVVKADSLKK